MNLFNLLTTTIYFARFPNIDGVTVDNAKIIGVDLTNTEGVIHVIDAVIPNKPETPSAMCTAPVKNY
jgi:transforming growth factor-beta-induced protein